MKKIEIEGGLKKIEIPTVAEVMKKEKFPLEEAVKKCIIICGNLYKNNNGECFRKLSGHKICQGCPKYFEKNKNIPRVSKRR